MSSAVVDGIVSDYESALAAERDGNDADADGHNAAAVAFLDQAIDEAGCPTA